MRDYSRAFYESVSNLEKKRVKDFILEYAEAVEEDKERQKKNPKPAQYRPPHARRR